MEKWLLLPVFIQVLLTSIVMVLMGHRRITAARNKEITLAAFRTMNLSGANERVVATSRNFDNQFQIPVLYFFSVLLVLHFGLADIGFVILGCLFVALRGIHTVVHIGKNNVRHRFSVFLAGVVVVWLIWLRLLWLVMFS